MALVASAVIVGGLLRAASMSTLSGDGKLINLAGRQRMLSQRIASKSGQLTLAIEHGDPDTETQARQQLAVACGDWSAAQHVLRERFSGDASPEEGIRSGGAGTEELSDLFEQMDGDFLAVLGAAQRLVRVSEAEERVSTAELDRLSRTISASADLFLPSMNKAVGLIERGLSGKLAAQRRVQAGLEIATLLVIAAGCVLVFEPLVRWHRVLTSRLQDAADAAEQGNRAKTAFLANMSHEIRTPITAIMGYSKLIADDPDPNATNLGEWSRTVERNARHLLNLVNDILDVSKIEAGRMTIENIDTDPAIIIEETVSLLRLGASEKSIGLRIEYDSALPDRILTDPVRLRQILLNLAGNAVKFTREGGVTIRVCCDRSNDRLICEVVDTGEGLSEEQLGKIRRFESFTQADASTTRHHGGTGLGLKLCNTLLELMGGSLEIESVQGEGSTFRVIAPTGPLKQRVFRLPSRVERDATDGETGGARMAQRLDGVRILLAEDGADNRRLFEFFLRSAGADVRSVEHGADAVAFFERGEAWRPTLVLMDMQMPILDGYGATRRLRKLGVGVPIIALTANALMSDRQWCIDAGCDDYISKPVERWELVANCAMWSLRSRREAA